MANRRFEMYQYRQVLVRMRLGESSRAIARSGLMGRTKVEVLREIAGDQGWLDPDRPLPDDGTLASALRCPSARAYRHSQIDPKSLAHSDLRCLTRIVCCGGLFLTRIVC